MSDEVFHLLLKPGSYTSWSSQASMRIAWGAVIGKTEKWSRKLCMIQNTKEWGKENEIRHQLSIYSPITLLSKMWGWYSATQNSPFQLQQIFLNPLPLCTFNLFDTRWQDRFSSSAGWWVDCIVSIPLRQTAIFITKSMNPSQLCQGRRC